MEDEEGNGAATPPLEPRRHELLAVAVRDACGSSLHSYELRGQLREFSSTSTSPFRWWCQVISRVCSSSVFQLAHTPKYYGP